MKRILSIAFSSILLTLLLLGTAGVSVEKCKCSGKVSILVVPVADCCPSEGNCMVVKTMSLTDYIPVSSTTVDLPDQPVLFSIIPDIVLVQDFRSTLQPCSAVSTSPPGRAATTVEVLRV